MLAALYHGYWGVGAVGEGVVVSSPGGAQTQIVPPGILCAAVVTQGDGTGGFYPGYFCGVSNKAEDSSNWRLTLLPFDPTSGLKPLTVDLSKGAKYQTVGAFPSIGVYPSAQIINISAPISFPITVP